MEPSKAAMKAALRVLTALNERQEPAQSDIDELHWYAPSDRERPLDELVCDAIQRALKDRENARQAVKATQRERALALNAQRSDEFAVPQPLDREISRLIRETGDRWREYLALCDKLKRLGAALQIATANILAADSANVPASSEEARRILAPLSAEVDLSGIMQLLNEHVRLTTLLVSNRQTLKEYGIEL